MRNAAIRLYYTAGWLAITVSLIVMLTGIWWMVGPHTGLVAQQDPAMLVTQSEIQAGGVIQYTVKYCVDEDLPLPITVDRILELQPSSGDPVSWPIAPPIAYEITERCETKTRLLGVPLFIIPGKYHLHSTSTLQVNPFRQVKQSWMSNEFQVIAFAPTTGPVPNEFVPFAMPEPRK